MVEQGFEPPILVGGAAVELYTASAIATGDFDIVTARQEEFERLLAAAGFSKPGGIGHTPGGWMHVDLRLGFEVVSGSLLDGMADRERVFIVDLEMDGSAAVISIEDIIADRLGQFASNSAPDMLEQARTLFQLYPDADQHYMKARIGYETGGDLGIADLAP